MMPPQHQQHQHQQHQHQQSVLVSPVYSVLNMGYGFGSQMHSGITGQMSMGNQEQMQENQIRSDGSTIPPAQHIYGSQQQFGVSRRQAGRGDSDNE
jgi:hypothetical protein